jgi:hypothetical protein
MCRQRERERERRECDRMLGTGILGDKSEIMLKYVVPTS